MQALVLVFILSISSALKIDWDDVKPRHINPVGLGSLPDIPPLTNKITGGEEAVPNSFPHQAALYLIEERGRSFCGGSLIDREWVLTAAHCIEGISEAVVILGAHNIRNSSEPGRIEIEVPAENLIINEDYDSRTVANDIGLIKIPPVNLTDTIQLISLPKLSDANNSFEGLPAVTSGWGRISDKFRSSSSVLRFITKDVMNLTECKMNMFNIPTDSNVCIDGKSGQSTCNGDSGGPLTVNDTSGELIVIGITSFGLSSGCEKGSPSAFTRVTSYLEWIVEKTGLMHRA